MACPRTLENLLTKNATFNKQEILTNQKSFVTSTDEYSD